MLAKYIARTSFAHPISYRIHRFAVAPALSNSRVLSLAYFLLFYYTVALCSRICSLMISHIPANCTCRCCVKVHHSIHTSSEHTVQVHRRIHIYTIYTICFNTSPISLVILYIHMSHGWNPYLYIYICGATSIAYRSVPYTIYTIYPLHTLHIYQP